MAEQQNSIDTGAQISADGRLRFSPAFYETVIRLCVNRARETYFQALDVPKNKFELQFAEAHKGVKTMLPVGFLTYQLNQFFDFLVSEHAVKEIIGKCNNEIALSVIMKPMPDLINEAVPRIVRAFRVILLEYVETTIDKQEEHILSKPDDESVEAKKYDVVIKNRQWIISSLEAASNALFTVDEPETEQQEQQQNEDAE